MKINDFSFTREMTNIAKGLAIFLMVYHHLFTFPERISSVQYVPLMMIGNLPLDQIIGSFGKICVSIFLFLSGYGLYKSYTAKGFFTFKESIKKTIPFLKMYWIIFIIFVPIGLIWFSDQPRYIFNFKDFILNFLTFTTTYNREWWFVPLYIELLLIFPIIIKLVNKSPIVLNYLSFICLFFAAFFQKAITLFPNNEFIQIALNHLSFLSQWQVVFIVGILFAKYSVFEKINSYLNALRLDHLIFYLGAILFCFYLRQFTLPWIIDIRGARIDGIHTYSDFILTPILIFSFVKIISKVAFLTKIFVILGNHSNNIWLIHTFFIFYYFQELTFYPHFSILIVIWVFILTIPISSCINYMNKVLTNLFQQKD